MVPRVQIVRVGVLVAAAGLAAVAHVLVPLDGDQDDDGPPAGGSSETSSPSAPTSGPSLPSPSGASSSGPASPSGPTREELEALAQAQTGRIDLPATCGSPVVAAASGQVSSVDRTAQGWTVTLPGGSTHTTTYSGMYRAAVAKGQTVAKGQQLGQLGELGGEECRLGLRVAPAAGSTVDPADEVIKLATASLGRADSVGFRISTFNTLGASHTGPRGKSPQLGSGPDRTRGMIRLFDGYDVEVAGLQEFQRSQWETLAADGTYGLYRGDSARALAETQNGVAWRKDAWFQVEAHSLEVPYAGRYLYMPVVLLQQRATGQQAWFMSAHNPADTRRFRNQARWRRVAEAAERAHLIDLGKQTGLPVFLMGDLNDRAPAFCYFAGGGLVAAAGGSNDGTCRMPSFGGIDWIFGLGDVRFDSHVVNRNTNGTISDHPMIVANAYLSGG